MPDKHTIIAQVQAGNFLFANEENIFVPMTPEQRDARKANFLSGVKMNMNKLEQRARFVAA